MIAMVLLTRDVVVLMEEQNNVVQLMLENVDMDCRLVLMEGGGNVLEVLNLEIMIYVITKIMIVMGVLMNIMLKLQQHVVKEYVVEILGRGFVLEGLSRILVIH